MNKQQKKLDNMDPARLDFIRRAVGYRAKGLTYGEIGKLLDCHKDTARHAVKQALELGLMEVPNG